MAAAATGGAGGGGGGDGGGGGGDAGGWLTFVIDASAEGCSGMFWRTKPDMAATASDSGWPRNGTTARGRYSKEHAGWVQFENGYWLPVKQAGVTVTHELDASTLFCLGVAGGGGWFGVWTTAVQPKSCMIVQAARARNRVLKQQCMASFVAPSSALVCHPYGIACGT